MIRFDDVTMVYMPGAKPVLDSVTLEVEREKSMLLVGKSGSGKSTFLQLVMREVKATSGKVWALGQDVSKIFNWFVPKLRRQIGTAFQGFHLPPSKTVYENVALVTQVIGKPRHQARSVVPEVLGLVDLAGKEKRLPHELSGGEEQHVAITHAMVSRPELLLTDEPTGNPDPETSLGIMRLPDRINRQGTTVVMAMHDAEIVNQLYKRVIELYGGEAVRGQSRGVYGATRRTDKTPIHSFRGR